MVRIDERVIKSKAIMSNNNKYRYRLTRIWNDNKEIVGLIMLNPSKANVLKMDNTIMNISNYLIDRNYGGMDVVNLYSYMVTKPKNLTEREQEFEDVNDKYIDEVVNERCMTIIAWGSDNNEYKTRKREVENLIISYSSKLKCFKDKMGRLVRHPLHLKEDWELVNYQFTYI